MQTAMHPTFEQKLAVLAALLERSKLEKPKAINKADACSPQFQAFGRGKTWDVVEISTGAVQGFTFSYRSALIFVDIMEAAAGYNRLKKLNALTPSKKREPRTSS